MGAENKSVEMTEFQIVLAHLPKICSMIVLMKKTSNIANFFQIVYLSCKLQFKRER